MTFNNNKNGWKKSILSMAVAGLVSTVIGGLYFVCSHFDVICNNYLKTNQGRVHTNGILNRLLKLINNNGTVKNNNDTE